MRKTASTPARTSRSERSPSRGSDRRSSVDVTRSSTSEMSRTATTRGRRRRGRLTPSRGGCFKARRGCHPNWWRFNPIWCRLSEPGETGPPYLGVLKGVRRGGRRPWSSGARPRGPGGGCARGNPGAAQISRVRPSSPPSMHAKKPSPSGALISSTISPPGATRPHRPRIESADQMCPSASSAQPSGPYSSWGIVSSSGPSSGAKPICPHRRRSESDPSSPIVNAV